MGWLTYFAALAAGTAQPDNRHPLTIANAVVMSAAAVFIIVSEVIKRKKKTPSEHQKLSVRNGLVIAFFIVLTVFVCSMMYRSFNILQSTLRVGYSVFSDFAVHLGMIRSFSFGNNFPTQYSHFAGQDIRYHFMFEFLAGNLEYLGLPLDHAFNFPSIISFVSMSMLLFTFTVRLCGSRITGVIATLMIWAALKKAGSPPVNFLKGIRSFPIPPMRTGDCGISRYILTSAI